jgi:hypothetical protein
MHYLILIIPISLILLGISHSIVIKIKKID